MHVINSLNTRVALRHLTKCIRNVCNWQQHSNIIFYQCRLPSSCKVKGVSHGFEISFTNEPHRASKKKVLFCMVCFVAKNTTNHQQFFFYVCIKITNCALDFCTNSCLSFNVKEILDNLLGVKNFIQLHISSLVSSAVPSVDDYLLQVAICAC